MEKLMAGAFLFDLAHPKPSDFIPRLLRAAGLEPPLDGHCLPQGQLTPSQVCSHARASEGVAKSQSFLKAVVFKSEYRVFSLDLDPLLHSGVGRPQQRVSTSSFGSS